MQKRCMCCGRFFTPDRRVGDRQKACMRVECKRDLKRRSQKTWRLDNPEYFKDHYADYVKPWRQKKRLLSLAKISPKVIKDKIPPSKPYQQLVLLIPEDKIGVIKDEIRLRRVDISTFAAYGP